MPKGGSARWHGALQHYYAKSYDPHEKAPTAPQLIACWPSDVTWNKVRLMIGKQCQKDVEIIPRPSPLRMNTLTSHFKIRFGQKRDKDSR
jgi:hypothetical protein